MSQTTSGRPLQMPTPTPLDPAVLTLSGVLLTVIGTIVVALLTGRLNINTTKVEKETPPYVELANRVSRLEQSDQAKSRLIRLQQSYIATLLLDWPGPHRPPSEPEEIINWQDPIWEDVGRR